MHNVVMTVADTQALAHNDKRSRRGQVGVMDRGLAAVLGAAALLGLIGVYFHNTADVNADAQVNQINTIAAQVSRMYASQAPQYANISEAAIAQSGSLAPAWVDNTVAPPTLNSIYNSKITLAPAANPVTGKAGGAYKMTVSAVPQAACTILGTTTYAPNIGKTEIAAGAIAGVGPTTPVGDPAVVAAACAAGAAANGGVDVAFTFY